MPRHLVALLVVSLGAGGAAQWGWDEISSPGGDTTDLTVTTPNRAAGAASGQDSAARPVLTPAKAGANAIPTPGRRASRGTRPTTPAKPDASTSPGTPAPAPTKSADPDRTKPPAKPGKPALPDGPADARTRMETEVVALTNVERKKNGCGPLRADDRLRDAARGHSLDMKTRDFFDHTTPDGVDPWTRAKNKGYDQPSGENIARGQRTPADVVESWMDSPGHRQNILNCDSKAIGVGVALGDGGPWWTQMFGFV
jgi:uncharacterized protein YkwD